MVGNLDFASTYLAYEGCWMSNGEEEEENTRERTRDDFLFLVCFDQENEFYDHDIESSI